MKISSWFHRLLIYDEKRTTKIDDMEIDRMGPFHPCKVRWAISGPHATIPSEGLHSFLKATHTVHFSISFYIINQSL